MVATKEVLECQHEQQVCCCEYLTLPLHEPRVSEGTLHQGTTLAKKASTVLYAHDYGYREGRDDSLHAHTEVLMQHQSPQGPCS
jgi:hypothetical protein